MQRQDSSRFIPDSLGGRDVLIEDAPFIGTVEFFDGFFVFGPALLFLMFGELIVPQILEPHVPIMSIIIGLLGVSLLFLKPSYLTIKEWFELLKNYRSRDKDLQKNLVTDGGMRVKPKEAVPDEDTRELIDVSKVYTDSNVIELENGDMIQIIEFTGSNLDMASDDKIRQIIDEYSNSLSSKLENDIQFYLPMRPVSMKNTKNMYKENIEKGNASDFLLTYMQDRVNWIEEISENSFVRKHYVIVPVKKSEVLINSMHGSSNIRNLPGGDVIADIKEGLSGNTLQSKQEVKRKQIEEVNKRTKEVGNILAVGPGNKYKVLDANKQIALFKEFWEGKKFLPSETNSLTQSNPYMIPNKDNIGDKNDR